MCPIISYPVAESIPLKQGLKLDLICSNILAWIVAESIPLKQGLKLYDPELQISTILGCGEHSIKTRIETPASPTVTISGEGLRRAFH